MDANIYPARFETDSKTITDASTYPSRFQIALYYRVLNSMKLIPNRNPKTDLK
jgi:hypothetical protein